VLFLLGVSVGVGGVVLCRCLCVCDLLILFNRPQLATRHYLALSSIGDETGWADTEAPPLPPPPNTLLGNVPPNTGGGRVPPNIGRGSPEPGKAPPNTGEGRVSADTGGGSTGIGNTGGSSPAARDPDLDRRDRSIDGPTVYMYIYIYIYVCICMCVCYMYLFVSLKI